MRSWTHVDVIRWFEHSEVGQSTQAATQDSNELGNIDILLQVRRATPAITQGDQEHGLIRFRFISPQVKVIGKFLAEQLPPSDSCLRVGCAEILRIKIDQLKKEPTS
jgi:hypothetical protein